MGTRTTRRYDPVELKPFEEWFVSLVYHRSLDTAEGPVPLVPNLLNNKLGGYRIANYRRVQKFTSLLNKDKPLRLILPIRSPKSSHGREQ